MIHVLESVVSAYVLGTNHYIYLNGTEVLYLTIAHLPFDWGPSRVR